MKVLAADIGGTNARFMVYEVAEHNLSCPIDEVDPSLDRSVLFRQYKNDEFDRFTDVLNALIEECEQGSEFAAVCLAVAGPVRDNQISFTNRDWIINAEDIRVTFQFGSVQLLNDFVCNGYGLLALKPENLVTLQQGVVEEGAPLACVGAGTGLGECFLTKQSDSGLYRAYPSEGGHVEFAPRDQLEDELLAFLRKKFGAVLDDEHGTIPRVSVERVVSGNGLVNIFEFLSERFPDERQADLDDKILAATDSAGAIAQAAYDYPLCNQALEMMLSIYGGEVGNAALKYLPRAGLYICGGIAPKNMERIRGESAFMKSLLNKGRVSPAIEDIPIHLVLREELGVLGAHYAALQLARKGLPDESDNETAVANSALPSIHPPAQPSRQPSTVQLLRDHPFLINIVSQTIIATGVSFAVFRMLKT